MLKIHKPYKFLVIGTTLFVSGALLVGYCSTSSGFGETVKTYAAEEDFSTEYRTISDIEYMQDMNQQICSNTDTPAPNSPVSAHPTATLIDKRDNESYTIVKLEDGNCWMQQNLRLKGATNLVDPQNQGTLTAADTDLDADEVPSGRWRLPTSLTALNTNDFSSNNYYIAQSYYKTSTYATSGVYYSWTAATAGVGVNSITSGKVGSSICPSGWTLPTGGNAGQFQNLYNVAGITNDATGVTKIKNLPYNFYYSGRISSGAIDNEGTAGYFWSGTADTANFAFYLHNNNPTASYARYRGFSVRCLADPDYMPQPAIPPSSKNGNITVNVTPTITLDVSDGVTAAAEADKVATGKIEATVTSNSDYDVLLSAKEPRLVGKENSNNYIPVVSDTNPVQPGNDAWGILNASGLYDPITTTPSLFDDTKSFSNNSTTHTFNVGISISPSLPADTYSTEVTVTAATK